MRETVEKVRELYNGIEHTKRALWRDEVGRDIGFQRTQPKIEEIKSACIYGVFYLATGRPHLHGMKDDLKEEEKFANFLGFDKCQSLVKWNNAPERMKEDVIKLLDEKLAETAAE